MYRNGHLVKFKWNDEIFNGIIRSALLKLRLISETEGVETEGYIIESYDFFSEKYPYMFNIVEDYNIIE